MKDRGTRAGGGGAGGREGGFRLIRLKKFVQSKLHQSLDFAGEVFFNPQLEQNYQNLFYWRILWDELKKMNLREPVSVLAEKS